MAQQESMFGPTPLAIQDQLDQQFLQRNSNLDLGSMSARAGLAIGNGINGLLGREDPRVAEAKQVQEAVAELRKSGVDMSNPEEYYKKMAGIFGAKGLTAQAEKAAMKALEYRDKQEERTFKTDIRKTELQIKSQDLAIKNAQLQKEIAKAKEKPGFAQLLDTLKNGYSTANIDQESLAKVFRVFNETLDINLALEQVRNKPDKEATPEKGTKVGLTAKTQEVVYANVDKKTGAEEQYVIRDGKRIPYAGPIDQKTASTSFRIAGPDQQLAFDLDQIKEGTTLTKEVDKQIRSLDNAYALLSTEAPAASSMAIRILAGAIQTGTLSQKDVGSVDNTGSLVDRLQNYASKGITGVPSKAVAADLKAGIKALREKSVESREEMLKPHRDATKRAGRDPYQYFPTLPKLKDKNDPLNGVSDKTRQTIEDLKRNP